MRTAKKRPGRTHRYDPAMIRDFLDHLLWELRAAHFEHAHPGKFNPELADPLARYALKNTAPAS